MTSEVVLFNQKVRTVCIDGKTWCIAGDIAQLIGLKNTSHTARSLPKDERMVATVHQLNAAGIQDVNNTGMLCVSVSAGLFLIMNSKKVPIVVKTDLTRRLSNAQNIIAALNCFEVPEGMDDMFVYAVRNPNTGAVKLGITKNPQARLAQLQTSCGEELELIGFKKAVNKFSDEKALHRKYKNKNIRVEWFELSEEQIDSLILV